jgi:hypothetical protein
VTVQGKSLLTLLSPAQQDADAEWLAIHNKVTSSASPAIGLVLFHSCSACWYCRRPMISLDAKWSGHPGPRATHSSLRPLHVECSGEHGSPVQGMY